MLITHYCLIWNSAVHEQRFNTYNSILVPSNCAHSICFFHLLYNLYQQRNRRNPNHYQIKKGAQESKE